MALPHRLDSIFMVSVLLLLLVPLSASCMRKEEPKRDVSSASAKTTPGPDSNSITEPCAKNDTYAKFCVNGGSCYVDINKIDSSRFSYCVCQPNFSGKYCQSFKTGVVPGSSVIAACVASAVVAVILVAVLIYVWRLRRHHQMNKDLNGGQREMTPSQFSQYTCNPSSASNGLHENVELLQVRTEHPRS